jgi:hypothetical protein
MAYVKTRKTGSGAISTALVEAYRKRTDDRASVCLRTFMANRTH